MAERDTEVYRVVETRVETPGVVTLALLHSSGTNPSFVPGQFITVYFPETNTPEGKAYSISSAPHEKTFSITVRALGEFSNRLCALQVHDTLKASTPYGFFSPEKEDTNLVLLASGIGITPFRSMLFSFAQDTPERRVALLHSVRTADDALFREAFETLRTTMPNLSLTYYVTRDTASAPFAHTRRMHAKDALPYCADQAQTEVLLCGSISFTRDLWRDLQKNGVPEERIYTEAFFSQ